MKVSNVNCKIKIIVKLCNKINILDDGIKESDLTAMKEKTNRHLRLRELLLENSQEANLIVM